MNSDGKVVQSNNTVSRGPVTPGSTTAAGRRFMAGAPHSEGTLAVGAEVDLIGAGGGGGSGGVFVNASTQSGVSVGTFTTAKHHGVGVDISASDSAQVVTGSVADFAGVSHSVEVDTPGFGGMRAGPTVELGGTQSGQAVMSLELEAGAGPVGASFAQSTTTVRHCVGAGCPQ